MVIRHGDAHKTRKEVHAQRRYHPTAPTYVRYSKKNMWRLKKKAHKIRSKKGFKNHTKNALQMRHKFSVNFDVDSRERIDPSLEGPERPSGSLRGGSRISKSSLNGPCSVTGVRFGPGW